MFSKLLEMYVLEECSNFSMHPSHFGFVQHRSTTTTISLAHDVCFYCNSRGSPIFLFSLDAEGALDEIPYPVLFHETFCLITAGACSIDGTPTCRSSSPGMAKEALPSQWNAALSKADSAPLSCLISFIGPSFRRSTQWIAVSLLEKSDTCTTYSAT